MSKHEMTSMERVLTALSHQEPDRVPMFLLTTMHGAKELGLSVKEYYSKAANLVEGQMRLREKYKSDCIYSFFYAPLELEAFGGTVIYSDDGPPNAGEPIIKSIQQIKDLFPPKVKDTKVLHKVLESIRELKAKVKDEVPIIGVVMSPFSLPVMQMGFDKYLELMHFNPGQFEQLLKVNEAFCIDWANSQLEAGATAICFFDPVSSTTIVTKEKYRLTGKLSAMRTIREINGPTATHLASGDSLGILDDIADTGTAAVGVSSLEDISLIKEKCKNKLTVLGNLNGVEMRRWSVGETINIVKDTINKAAGGGGFVLADNHGEIPFQVPDEVLLTISETVREYGKYPIGATANA